MIGKKVKCVVTFGTHLFVNELYEVVNENEYSYCIEDKDGKLYWYGKDRFN